MAEPNTTKYREVGAAHAGHFKVVDCSDTVKVHCVTPAYRLVSFMHQANKNLFQGAFPGLKIPVFDAQVAQGSQQARYASLLLL